MHFIININGRIKESTLRRRPFQINWHGASASPHLHALIHLYDTEWAAYLPERCFQVTKPLSSLQLVCGAAVVVLDFDDTQQFCLVELSQDM